MGVNVGASVAFPLKDPKGATRISLGIAMTMGVAALGWAASFFNGYGRLGYRVGYPLEIASLFGALLVSLLMSGYLTRTLHQLLSEKEALLPPWSQPGDLLKKGLGLTIANSLYLLGPGMLLGYGFRAVFSSVWVEATTTPQGAVIPAHAATAADAVTVSGMSLGFVVGGIGFLVCLAVLFLLPMVMLRYASTLNLFSALNPFRVIKDIRRNGKGYLGALALWFLMYLMAGLVLHWLFPVAGPWLFTAASFVFNLMGLHMLSQHQRTLS